MKTPETLLRLIILVAALTITGYSCKKENEAVDDAPQGFPGKLAVEHFSREAPDYRSYSYHEDGTVQRIKTVHEQQITDQFDFTYTNNRLSSIDLYTGSNNKGLELHQQHQYVYDNKGRLANIYVEYIPVPEKDTTTYLQYRYEFIYENDEDSLVNHCVVYDKRDGTYLAYHEYHFSYDIHGNISTVSLYQTLGGTLQKQYDYQYEYQQLNNPNRQLGLLNTSNFVSYFSPHVWTKETFHLGMSEYIAYRTYETDADGRVNAYTDDQGSKVELEYY